MTAQPPDPDPDRTPGLDRGTGVRPGDTPPDSGSTSGLSHPQGMPSRTGPTVTLVVVAVLAIAVVAMVIAQVAGLIDVLW